MKENRKLNHLHIQIPHEFTALKISKEMVQPFAILESPAMKFTREIAQSLALQDSVAMKVTRELAQSLAFQDSAAMKVTRELARSLAFQDSAAMKTTRELAQSLAFQNSAAMKVAREVAQSFALQESAAMKAVREMTLSLSLQQSVVVTAEQINKLLHEEEPSIESLSEVEINSNSVEQAITELLDKSSSGNYFSFLNWFDSQPASTQLIIGLVFSYWVNILSNLSMPLYDDWTYLFENETARVAAKLVSISAEKEYDINELDDYRFIVASRLNIRNGPSIHAKIIDNLENGKVVKFISKSKDWSQVEFLYNETGERKVGWVFSRYLQKFKI